MAGNESLRRAAVDALDRIDPDLGAFITVEPDAVLRAASRARPGRLHGCLVAVKDIVDTTALPTTYGSARYAEHRPASDAAVVRALLADGAVVLGKTNLNEFAFGVTGYNPHYGPMVHPGDRSRTVGGSSGGSAVAVAAGVCALAVGTDTGGSVRIPAALAGIWGLKCAHGLGMDGIHPLVPSYDSLGYLAAGPDDLQRVLDIETLPAAQQLRIGAVGVDVHPPPLPAEHWTVYDAELWAVHGEQVEIDADSYGIDITRRVQAARAAADDVAALSAARRVTAAWRADYTATVAGYDVLVDRAVDGEAPLVTAASSTDPVVQAELRERLLRHTPAANALGWPAVAFPTPHGPRQAIGPPGTEAALLAVAKELSSGS